MLIKRCFARFVYAHEAFWKIRCRSGAEAECGGGETGQAAGFLVQLSRIHDECQEFSRPSWMESNIISQACQAWMEKRYKPPPSPTFSSSSTAFESSTAAAAVSAASRLSSAFPTISILIFLKTPTNHLLSTLNLSLYPKMQFSRIIATLSLALAATAAPAIEARTGGGQCNSVQYSNPVCCNGVTGPKGSIIEITVINQAQCLLGAIVLGSICSQSANNLCCNQAVNQVSLFPPFLWFPLPPPSNVFLRWWDFR